MSSKISSDEVPDEVWKDTYSPNYMVSSLGRVWNKKKKRLIRFNQKGACACKLCNPDGSIDRWYVSHLVYYTFRGKKPKKLEYIDGDCYNPRLSNLRRDPNVKANFLPKEWEEIKEERRKRAEEKKERKKEENRRRREQRKRDRQIEREFEKQKKEEEEKGADYADTYRDQKRFVWKRKT